ncbi:SRPBCC family protein [Spongiibacter marinus]|uniref:SRPBCC family protein n=1 Tax=Spongiibacter marinus TaxID=354246 RepID=UPI0035BE53CC
MNDCYECVAVGLSFLDEANTVYRCEEIVKASHEQIFDVFENEIAWTQWAFPIQRVEWTSPKPFGVGTTRTVYMMGDMKVYEEFIAWERGKRMAFTFLASNKENPEKFLEDYRVTDLGNGCCKVEWYMAMEKRGGPSWRDTIARPIMARVNRSMFKKFRKYTERYAAQQLTLSQPSE